MSGFEKVFRAVVAVLLIGRAAAGAAVSGRVEMPALCSTVVSPAVVRLEPLESSTALPPLDGGRSRAHFIDQRGMIFEPRVVAMRAGETLRFGNADPDSHNVHIRGSGTDLNQVVPPGGSLEFVPTEPGVLRVLCDVHSHMRAFVVVGKSPWVAACDRGGRFAFEGVPEGRYRLHVWHEMGPPLARTVAVSGAEVDLGTLVATGGPNPSTQVDRGTICETGCEPWPLVIDRISVTLAESLDAASRPDSARRAVPLAQDAYYRDFESSGMGTAIRVYLGRDRATRVEDLFRDITHATSADPGRPTRRVLMALTQASAELNRKGVTERSRIFSGTSPAFWVEDAPAKKPAAVRPAFAGAFLDALGTGFRTGLGAAVVLALLHASVSRCGPAGAGGLTSRRMALGLFAGCLAAVAVLLLGDERQLASLPRAAVEGSMVLAASVALFHVAVGLTESRSAAPIALTAFLAAFPAAAGALAFGPALFETGMVPAAAGVAIALVLLSALGVTIARVAARLPDRALGLVAAAAVTALAVAFAGQGVGDLQSARLVRAGGAGWNLPCLAAQAVLIAGALALPLLAWFVRAPGETNPVASS